MYGSDALCAILSGEGSVVRGCGLGRDEARPERSGRAKFHLGLAAPTVLQAGPLPSHVYGLTGGGVGGGTIIGCTTGVGRGVAVGGSSVINVSHSKLLARRESDDPTFRKTSLMVVDNAVSL